MNVRSEGNEAGVAVSTEEKKPARWGVFLISCVFWLPMLSGVLSRVFKHSRWFGDYGAIACAAEKLLQGKPIYDMHLACPGMNATVYVYHPFVVEAFAQPLAWLGQTRLLYVYAALFTLAVAGLLWIIIGRTPPGLRSKRSWFAAFITGSAIYWANIGVILHALIAVAAVALRKRPSVLVLMIALAALVKPVFLVFAVVFALQPWPLWRRTSYALAALALGAAPTVWLLVAGGPLAEQWRAMMNNFVFQNTGDGRPGDAFLGWLAFAHAPVAGLAPGLGYLAYAGLMTLAGLVTAEGLKLDADRRALFALSLGVLLMPRLMSQDYWLLGPGLIGVAAAIGERAPGAGKWMERAMLTVCVAALIGNMADLADTTNRITTLALALIVAATAVWTAAHGLAAPGALWRQIWNGRLVSAEA